MSEFQDRMIKRADTALMEEIPVFLKEEGFVAVFENDKLLIVPLYDSKTDKTLYDLLSPNHKMLSDVIAVPFLVTNKWNDYLRIYEGKGIDFDNHILEICKSSFDNRYRFPMRESTLHTSLKTCSQLGIGTFVVPMNDSYFVVPFNVR